MTAGVPGSGGTFVIASATGYPSANFVITMDKGQANEEKILISSRSGTTLTVASGGRGFDNTTASAHTNGVSTVDHVIDAAMITALLEHVNTNAAQDHANLLAVANKGLLADITTVDPSTALAGATGRWADAGHRHVVPTIPFFELTNAGTQSVTNNSPTEITWGAEEDTHSGHVAGAAEYTIPTGWGGIWHLDALIEYAFNATGTRQVLFIKGIGTELYRVAVPATPANPCKVHVAGNFRLVAGDTVKVRALQDSGGALNILNAIARVGGAFSGYWVRA
jgi:hypothetical protein